MDRPDPNEWLYAVQCAYGFHGDRCRNELLCEAHTLASERLRRNASLYEALCACGYRADRCRSEWSYAESNERADHRRAQTKPNKRL